MEHHETKRWPAVPGFARETAQLISALKDGKPGDVLTDEHLSRVIERDCSNGGDGRRYVLSACKYLLRTHGVAWERVKGEGSIKCLSADERLESAKGSGARGRRWVKKGMATMPPMDDLAPDKRSDALLTAAQLGGMEMFSRAQTRKQLEGGKLPNLKALLERVPK